MSSDGTEVYAVSATTTYVFSRNTQTGLLNSITTIAGGGHADSLLPQTTNSVYVLNSGGPGGGSIDGLQSKPTEPALVSAAIQLADSSSVPLPLSGLQSLVSDGKSNLYGVSPTNNALVQLSTSLGLEKVAVNAYNGDLGLQGASAVAVSPDQQFVYVAATAENSVAVFATGALNEIGLLTGISGLSNPRSITVSPDGKQVFVGGQTGLATLSRAPNGQIAFASVVALNNVAQVRVSPDGQFVYALDDIGNHLTVLSRDGFGKLTVVQTLTENSNGITGLASASDVTSSADNQFVYVTAANDNSVAVFQRGTTGLLTEIQVIQEGQFGARGLIGAHGVGLLDTAAGHYLVVAGYGEDALAVFQRNATTGLLVFVQVVRNNVGGVAGLREPNSIAVSPDGSSIFVGSSAGTGSGTGGVAMFTNLGANASILPPTVNTTSFTNMQGLTLSTGPGDDTISLRSAPQTAQTTIETGGGFNTVNLSDLSATTNVILGDTSNQLVVQSSAANAILNVTGGAGPDSFNVQQLGVNSRAIIDGGAGDDTFQIAGANLSASATVTIHGSSQNTADTLLFDPSNNSITPTAPGPNPGSTPVSVKVVNAGTVNYDGIETLEVIKAPVITPFNLSPIHEGDSLQLNVSVNYLGLPQSPVQLDLNGDGIFGDAVGSPVSLSWAQLTALGLNQGAGTYPITVQATNSQGTSDFTTMLTILATPPTLAVTAPPTATVGQPYTINLSAFEIGHDTVTNWLVYWGDSPVPQSFGSTATSATHVYGAPNAAGYSISVQAVDQKFTTTYPNPLAVVVADAAPTISQFIVPATGVEGSAISLSVTAQAAGANPALTYAWTVAKNGQTFATSTSPSFGFTPDASTAATDSYLVNLKVTDVYGMATNAGSTIVVADVAPTVLAVQIGALAFAALPTQFMVIASDPGGLDSIATFKYDFDNSGAYATTSASATVNYTFAAPGIYQVNVIAVDKAGIASALFSVQVQILPVVPVAPVSGSATGTEGVPYTLALGPLTNPAGSADPIITWNINWGDGTDDTLAGSATTATHTYTDDAIYTISATVTNVDGTYAAANMLAVNIAPATPLLTISGPTAVNEGPYTLNLAAANTFNDPISSWTINWGDGVTQTYFGNPSTVTHTFAGTATETISASATNSLGSFAANSLFVQTTNLPPTIISVSTVEPIVVAGSPVTLKVSATDAGGARVDLRIRLRQRRHLRSKQYDRPRGIHIPSGGILPRQHSS